MALTDPTNDDDRAAPGGPAGLGEQAAAPTVGNRDGGVSARLIGRCRIAACLATAVGGCFLLVAALRSWDIGSAVLTMVAAGALAGAAVLARRARLWRRISPTPIVTASGRPATIGQPRPLSPGRPGAQLNRKLGAVVVPIRVPVGPQPGGGALVVHARRDAVALAAGDAALVWAVGQRRFVLYRETDEAVFLATTRLTDTW